MDCPPSTSTGTTESEMVCAYVKVLKILLKIVILIEWNAHIFHMHGVQS